VLTARTEITDQMLIFGQRHLRAILDQYAAHYNGRRPHRSRQLRPPRPNHPPADLATKRIQRRPVLGGLTNEYERVRIESQVNTSGRSFCVLAYGPVDSEGMPPHIGCPSPRPAAYAAQAELARPRAAPWVIGGLDFRPCQARIPICGRYTYPG
jgi:hypothetical protein